jgi:hypothetical protein
MKTDNPARVATGRLAFVDPQTVLYVPYKATVSEARAALREIYHRGLLRPVPNRPGEVERVHPTNFIPTNDPHVWFTEWYRPSGEIFQARLIERYAGVRANPGPWTEEELNQPADPLRTQ